MLKRTEFLICPKFVEFESGQGPARLLAGLLSGLVMLTASSCGSYTYVGSLTYFPTNATEHTEYTLQVTANGERCKAYSAFGKKRVFVTVFHNGSPILTKDYSIEAGRLHWVVSWDEFSSPQIRFFDGDTKTTIESIVLKVEPAAKR